MWDLYCRRAQNGSSRCSSLIKELLKRVSNIVMMHWKDILVLKVSSCQSCVSSWVHWPQCRVTLSLTDRLLAHSLFSHNDHNAPRHHSDLPKYTWSGPQSPPGPCFFVVLSQNLGRTYHLTWLCKWMYVMLSYSKYNKGIWFRPAWFGKRHEIDWQHFPTHWVLA